MINGIIYSRRLWFGCLYLVLLRILLLFFYEVLFIVVKVDLDTLIICTSLLSSLICFLFSTFGFFEDLELLLCLGITFRLEVIITVVGAYPDSNVVTIFKQDWELLDIEFASFDLSGLALLEFLGDHLLFVNRLPLKSVRDMFGDVNLVVLDVEDLLHQGF